MEDVDKLNNIQDGFSTTSSYSFAKRPGCNISTAMCSSRTKTCYTTQQHVDHKIANALLKKGTRDALACLRFPTIKGSILMSRQTRPSHLSSSRTVPFNAGASESHTRDGGQDQGARLESREQARSGPSAPPAHTHARSLRGPDMFH